MKEIRSKSFPHNLDDKTADNIEIAKRIATCLLFMPIPPWPATYSTRKGIVMITPMPIIIHPKSILANSLSLNTKESPPNKPVERCVFFTFEEGIINKANAEKSAANPITQRENYSLRRFDQESDQTDKKIPFQLKKENMKFQEIFCPLDSEL